MALRSDSPSSLSLKSEWTASEYADTANRVGMYGHESKVATAVRDELLQNDAESEISPLSISALDGRLRGSLAAITGATRADLSTVHAIGIDAAAVRRLNDENSALRRQVQHARAEAKRAGTAVRSKQVESAGHGSLVEQTSSADAEAERLERQRLQGDRRRAGEAERRAVLLQAQMATLQTERDSALEEAKILRQQMHASRVNAASATSAANPHEMAVALVERWRSLGDAAEAKRRGGSAQQHQQHASMQSGHGAWGAQEGSSLTPTASARPASGDQLISLPEREPASSHREADRDSHAAGAASGSPASASAVTGAESRPVQVARLIAKWNVNVPASPPGKQHPEVQTAASSARGSVVGSVALSSPPGKGGATRSFSSPRPSAVSALFGLGSPRSPFPTARSNNSSSFGGHGSAASGGAGIGNTRSGVPVVPFSPPSVPTSSSAGLYDAHLHGSGGADAAMLRAQVEALSLELEESNHKIPMMLEHLTEVMRDAQRLEAALEDERKEKESAAGRATEAEAHVQVLEKQCTSLRSRVEAGEDTIQTLMRQVESAESKAGVDLMKLQIAMLKGDVARLSQELEPHKAEALAAQLSVRYGGGNGVSAANTKKHRSASMAMSVSSPARSTVDLQAPAPSKTQPVSPATDDGHFNASRTGERSTVRASSRDGATALELLAEADLSDDGFSDSDDGSGSDHGGGGGGGDANAHFDGGADGAASQRSDGPADDFHFDVDDIDHGLSSNASRERRRDRRDADATVDRSRRQLRHHAHSKAADAPASAAKAASAAAAQAETEIEALRMQLDSAIFEVARQRNAAAEATAEVAILNDRINDLKSLIASERSRVEDAMVQLAQAETKVSEQDEQLVALQTELEATMAAGSRSIAGVESRFRLQLDAVQAALRDRDDQLAAGADMNAAEKVAMRDALEKTLLQQCLELDAVRSQLKEQAQNHADAVATYEGTISRLREALAAEETKALLAADLLKRALTQASKERARAIGAREELIRRNASAVRAASIIGGLQASNASLSGDVQQRKLEYQHARSEIAALQEQLNDSVEKEARALAQIVALQQSIASFRKDGDDRQRVAQKMQDALADSAERIPTMVKQVAKANAKRDAAVQRLEEVQVKLLIEQEEVARLKHALESKRRDRDQEHSRLEHSLQVPAGAIPSTTAPVPSVLPTVATAKASHNNTDGMQEQDECKESGASAASSSVTATGTASLDASTLKPSDVWGASAASSAAAVANAHDLVPPPHATPSVAADEYAGPIAAVSAPVVARVPSPALPLVAGRSPSPASLAKTSPVRPSASLLPSDGHGDAPSSARAPPSPIALFAERTVTAIGSSSSSRSSEAGAAHVTTGRATMMRSPPPLPPSASAAAGATAPSVPAYRMAFTSYSSSPQRAGGGSGPAMPYGASPAITSPQMGLRSIVRPQPSLSSTLSLSSSIDLPTSSSSTVGSYAGYGAVATIRQAYMGSPPSRIHMPGPRSHGR